MNAPPTPGSVSFPRRCMLFKDGDVDGARVSIQWHINNWLSDHPSARIDSVHFAIASDGYHVAERALVFYTEAQPK